MTIVTTMPVSGDWTVDDLDRLPDDGLRYELVDGAPLLAVEVLSRSTRATDATLERHVFEQAGVPSSWLLDPESPSLTVLELVDGVRPVRAPAAGGRLRSVR